MEKPPRVLNFDELPSPAHFQSQVESQNVPAVLRGCIKDWKAICNWNPSNGGLDYLQERVGSSVVEAMLSRSAPVFYGDIRSHEIVPLPFSTFITSCKQRLKHLDDNCGVCVESENHEMAESTAGDACVESSRQVYLAQVPILNFENKEKSQLETLRDDIEMPTVLEGKALASINLWMNNAKSRSSTHYDPHQNILCIVAGCKQVALWPPSASSFLYPMPIYGEASNHSSVDMENPDYAVHSRAINSIDYSQNVTLRAGDALFIPEGWFHQVDSEDLTIAVNYWWQSSIICSMMEHMDAYYLRIILRRLVNKEMDLILGGALLDTGKSGVNVHWQVDGQAGNEYELDQKCGTLNLKGTTQKQNMMLNQMEPLALQELHKLVSLVHDGINVDAQSLPMQPTSIESSEAHMRDGCSKSFSGNLYRLRDDPVATILWTVEPLQLQSVFMAMVHNFPRTLEALILHMLSPVGAEVLTRKFDEMDRRFTKEERDKFYQMFYGVFDDQFAVMETILSRKESFALEVFQNVLEKYMGVNLMKRNC